ncbi:MAG: hypothetical protein MUE78_08610 [Ilumatobacteraceae bacterium]|jgi:hypothetical protein|nr:hypothetical protein [Ilumatobacteraceae bacterium]
MDVLSWIGAVAVVASLALADPLRFRVVNLVAAVVMLVANVRLGLLAFVTLNAVIIAVNAWHIRELASGPGRRTVGRRPGSHGTSHRLTSSVDAVRIQQQLR